MPVYSTDGVLGVEALHTWNGVITLNDKSGWPRIVIKRIRGLHDLPDSDDNREANTERIGETVYPSYARGKTITYEGEIRARSLHELRFGGQILRTAFGPDVTTGLNPERRMVIAPHASYVGPDSTQFTFTAQCRLVTLEDEQSSKRFARAFVVDLRLSDPRIYEWNGTTASSPRW